MSMNCENKKDLIKNLKKDATAITLSVGTLVGGAPVIVFASEIPKVPITRKIKPVDSKRVSEEAKAELVALLEEIEDEIGQKANLADKTEGRKTVKAEDINLEAFR